MSQFPGAKPKRPPVRDSYLDSDYSPWMRFNERDFASTAETTVALQPAIVAVAAGVDMLAHSMEPAYAATPSLSTEFVSTWFITTLSIAGLKAVSCLLRNRGASLLRDAMAWLWKWILKSAWDAIAETFYSWLPFNGRLIRPRIKPKPSPAPDPIVPTPRRRIIDRLRPRRRLK